MTNSVEFKTKLQQGNRIQVPKVIRWKFQIECTQVLQVNVQLDASWRYPQKFYARMSKAGRIVIPKLTCDLLRTGYGAHGIVGKVFEVELAPSEEAMEAQDEDE